MGRTTTTQRGASRRTDRTAASRGGPARRGGATSRTPAAKRGAKAAPRSKAKTRRGARLAGPWMPVLVAGALVLAGWALYPAMRLQYQSARRAGTQQEQYEQLRTSRAALAAEVAALKTPEGVEKAAREKLGYTKNGENAYVVIPDGSAATSGTTAASMAGLADTTLLQDVLDAIFGVVPLSSPALEP